MKTLEDRVAALEAVAHPPMDLTKLATHLAETVAKVLESDPHQFSTRPCQTCLAVSSTIGRDFGCVARARKR